MKAADPSAISKEHTGWMNEPSAGHRNSTRVVSCSRRSPRKGMHARDPTKSASSLAPLYKNKHTVGTKRQDLRSLSEMPPPCSPRETLLDELIVGRVQAQVVKGSDRNSWLRSGVPISARTTHHFPGHHHAQGSTNTWRYGGVTEAGQSRGGLGKRVPPRARPAGIQKVNQREQIT